MSSIFEHGEIQENQSLLDKDTFNDTSENYLWTEVINQKIIEQKEYENLIPKSILDSKFYLLKKIGKGSSSKIYLGTSLESFHSQNSKFYSIKVLEKTQINMITYNNEIKILQSLAHKNIITLYSYGEGEKKSCRKNKSKNVYYIVTEYLEHNDILKYISELNQGENIGFGEDFGRLIFSQLLDGLEHMHNFHISHRDIKPNNIMFGGDNYTIKFIDFGFATDQIGKLETFLGTPTYSPPEIYLKKAYYGKSSDIFSLGVTLFVLVTGCLPFKLAVPNDNLYRYIIQNDYITFWRQKMQNLSPNFMELFDNMIAFDYSQRPSISEIRQSSWMKEINFNLIPYLKQELILREKKIKSNEQIKSTILKQLKDETFQTEESYHHSLIEAQKKEKKIEKDEDMRKNKGMIKIKTKYKNLNVILVKIKKFLRDLGYVSNKHNYNNHEIELTDGEIDILLKILGNKNGLVKLFYYQTNGVPKKFEHFLKAINNLKTTTL